MTDTNQNSELFELCKEVYRRTKLPIAPGMFHFDKDGYVRMRSYGHGVAYLPGNGDVPLYTSDYLLEKLPATIENTDYHNGGINRKKRIALNLRKWDRFKNGGVVYFAEYHEMYYSPLFIKEADTPLKALLKLTIALSDAGELNE